MRIKRLNLERWMRGEEDRSTCRGFVESTGIFFKDGYYKCGDVTWFEVGGKAFIYVKPETMFDYTLKCLEAWYSLNIHKVLALEGIIKQGLATKKQVEIYRYYCRYWECRNILRGCTMLRVKLIGK